MLFLLFILFSVTRAHSFISVISESYSYVSYPDYRILNDGNIIPTVALGTFTPYQSVRYSGAIEQAVITAIEAGYRHIDTAPLYYDEGEIGNAINNVTSRGIVTREELFITTKLDLRVNDTAGVIPSLLSSLERLQLYYVDLFLIHFSEALGTGQEYDILALWRGMEEAQKIGLTVSIGVSNFNSSHINKILTYGTIRPAVNQIEVNPTYTELELTAYCLREGIAVMSYAPYGFMVPRPFRNITAPPPTFDDQTLRIIANKYGKTTKQVVLRYLIDRGTIPIPQSVYKDEIEENIDIFDFRLTREEVYLINEFNKNVKVYSNDDLSSADFLFNYAYGCDTATISKVNPTFANLELVAYCQQENITVVACGSHGFTVPRPFRSVSPSPPPQFNNTLLVEIAKKYSKTTNQVILRYLIDRKVIPLVKSTNITHIRENFDLFDFKLTKDEVYEINNFNENIKVYDYTFSEAEGLPKYFYDMDLKEFYDQQGVKY